MNKLTFEDTVNLHDRILFISGGLGGIQNEGLISSAIGRAFSGTSDGIEFYGSLFSKAAAITQSLCLNHGFVDGNKRTGLAAGMLFLFRNGYYIPVPEVDVATAFVLGIVDENRARRVSVGRIAEWFRRKAKPIEEGYSEERLRHVTLRYTH